MRRLPGFRVLALDLPGHGKSDGVALQKVEDYTTHVERFLREVGVYSLVMVGHSLGGAVAVHFARKNTEQVKGLALLSMAARFPIYADIMHAVADQETYPIGLSMIKQRFFSPRTPPDVRVRIIQPLRNQRNTVLYSDFLAATAVDFRSGPGKIACPCWLATGRQDLLTPVSMAQALTAMIREAEISLIPSAGHMLPLEQPAQVARGLQRFLFRHDNFVDRALQK